MLLAACSLLPLDADRGRSIRIERIENAVAPMARAALSAGQIETARRLYQRLLEADPASVAARTGLGTVAMAARDPAQAVVWYQSAVAHAGDPVERHAALLAHGRAAVAAGDLEAARRSFTVLADPRENAPSEHAAWALNGLGTVCLLEGDPDCAVASVERAALRDPNEPALRRNLAFVLKTQSHYRELEVEAAEDGMPVTATAPTAPEVDARHVEPRSPEMDEATVPVTTGSEREAPPAVADETVAASSPESVPEALPDSLPPAVAVAEEDAAAPAEEPASAVADETAVAPSPESAPEALPDPLPPAVAVAEEDAAAPAEERTSAVADETVAASSPESAPEALPDPLPPAVAVVEEDAAAPAEERTSAVADETAVAPSPESAPEALPDPLPPAVAVAEEDAAAPAEERTSAVADETVAASSPESAPEALSDPLPPAVAVAEEDAVATAVELTADAPHDAAPSAPEASPLPAVPAPEDASPAASPYAGEALAGGFFVARTPDGGEFVQVAAFALPSSAHDMAAELRGVSGHPVVVEEADVGGAALHRVKIGPVPNADERDLLAAVLVANGYGMVGPATASAQELVLADEATVQDAPLVVEEDGRTYLQAGAYAEYYAADALAYELRELAGYPVAISELARDGDTPLYRVRVGPVEVEAAADLSLHIAAVAAKYRR